MLVHGFTTERYIREVTLPGARARLEGRRKPRRLRVVDPRVRRDRHRRRGDGEGGDGAVRNQIAFYGSTPAYAAVLDLHGWDDLHPS